MRKFTIAERLRKSISVGKKLACCRNIHIRPASVRFAVTKLEDKLPPAKLPDPLRVFLRNGCQDREPSWTRAAVELDYLGGKAARETRARLLPEMCQDSTNAPFNLTVALVMKTMLELRLAPNSLSILQILLIVATTLATVEIALRLLARLARSFSKRPDKTDRESASGKPSLSLLKLVKPAAHVLYQSWVGLIVLLQVFAWQLYLQGVTHDRIELLSLLIAVPMAIVLIQGLLKLASTQTFLGRGLADSVAVAQFASLAVLVQLWSVVPTPGDDLALMPGQLAVNQNVHAVTDDGKELMLYERRVTKDEFTLYLENSKMQMASLAKAAMRRSDGHVDTNCHGWVFTAGKHIVQGHDVDVILQGNNYTAVDQPRNGDLVVYRDGMGGVMHTGIVCGMVNDRDLLIQSKWGVEGVFIHLVDEQPYSLNYQFFRSPRGDHLLKMIISPGDACNSSIAEIASMPSLISG